MAGLSIVLEKNITVDQNKNNPQVVSKVSMSKVATAAIVAETCRRSSPVAGFLDRCFLCGRKLLAGKDIYMYKGDKAFCSIECRCKQILMDEEEINNNNTNNGGFTRENCSSSSSRHSRKGVGRRNEPNGFVF